MDRRQGRGVPAQDLEVDVSEGDGKPQWMDRWEAKARATHAESPGPWLIADEVVEECAEVVVPHHDIYRVDPVDGNCTVLCAPCTKPVAEHLTLCSPDRVLWMINHLGFAQALIKHAADTWAASRAYGSDHLNLHAQRWRRELDKGPPQPAAAFAGANTPLPPVEPSHVRVPVDRGADPAKAELLEWYEDRTGQRTHIWHEPGPPAPAIRFATAEERDRAFDLLTRGGWVAPHRAEKTAADVRCRGSFTEVVPGAETKTMTCPDCGMDVGVVLYKHGRGYDAWMLEEHGRRRQDR